MPKRRRPRFVALVDELRRRLPDLDDPAGAIRARGVRVDGSIMTSTSARVRADASIVVRPTPTRRGAGKLRAALEAFALDVRDRVALDVGAASGGFTEVLLAAGASRVYAVDAGHGQLAGRLRQHERVVNLERVNVGRLDRVLVPDVVDVITIDLSYLALASALPQIEAIDIAADADLVALVKPMFELRAAALPSPDGVAEAVARVERALRHGRWVGCGSIESPVRGHGGAVEWFVHARRSAEA